MILILKQSASEDDILFLSNYLKQMGIMIQKIEGESTKMIGLAGDTSSISSNSFERYEFVERVLKVQESYKLAGRKFHPKNSVIDVSGNKIGDGNFAVMAGPCSVESEEQILSIAGDIKKSGATFLRGGAFKPRSSPYSFQGLGMEALELLKIAKQKTSLPIVTEIMSSDYLSAFEKDVDIIQIGARNMQNFALLKEVGKINKPVLLKRGLSSTIDETLMAAEYLMSAGCSDVILCERGIRTFENATRNTLDLSAVPVFKQKTHLPVIVDPSHATGYWHLVEPMALAAVACGADGLMIEVHNKPELALCDGAQSITPEKFHRLMKNIHKIRSVLVDIQK